MIELIEGLPGHIVGCRAKGQVTATDYEDVLIPAIRDTLREHRKISCYYEIGPAFTGMDPAAMWEDFTIGLDHWSRWERVAVVTDIGWITHAVNAFAFLMPCPVRVFAMDQRQAAREWISEISLSLFS